MSTKLREEKNCAVNTDRELWREGEGDYYAPSIHVTKGGGIGINVGGHVYVKSLRDWHALAEYDASPLPVSKETLRALDTLDAMAEQWADSVGLQAMAKSISDRPNSEDRQKGICAMIQLAWTEGAYTGRTSLETTPIAEPPQQPVAAPPTLARNKCQCGYYDVSRRHTCMSVQPVAAQVTDHMDAMVAKALDTEANLNIESITSNAVRNDNRKATQWYFMGGEYSSLDLAKLVQNRYRMRKVLEAVAPMLAQASQPAAKAARLGSEDVNRKWLQKLLDLQARHFPNIPMNDSADAQAVRDQYTRFAKEVFALGRICVEEEIAKAAQGWEPIESAPENHLPILVWHVQYGQGVAFRDVTWQWYSLPMARPLLKPTYWHRLPDHPCPAPPPTEQGVG